MEVLLSAPVAGMLLFGVLEVRHAQDVERRLVRTANRVAVSGPDAVSSERTSLSAELNVAEDQVRIETASPAARGGVKISVPYRETGSSLGFLWTDAVASGEAVQFR